MPQELKKQTLETKHGLVEQPQLKKKKKILLQQLSMCIMGILYHHLEANQLQCILGFHEDTGYHSVYCWI